MFTEGLDDKALNWIKQRALEKEQCQLRSPLTEMLHHDYPLPRSPLSFNSSSSKSTHSLPPLKFHSGLLGPLNTVSHLDSDESNDNDPDENESVASASIDIDGIHSYSEEDQLCYEEEIPKSANLNTNRLCNPNSLYKSSLNRGGLKENLRIEVPEIFKTGGMRESVQIHSAYGTPIGTLNDVADLGTPSAPPIFSIGTHEEDISAPESELSKGSEGLDINETINEVGFDTRARASNSGKSQRYDNRQNIDIRADKEATAPSLQTYPNTSGQNAWQTMVAYDACFRLCLNAWTRGCTEAPEFLRDECLVLRTVFGLHNFLLQPRALQKSETSTSKNEEAYPVKVKKVIGKIRVEVKKMRIIPRRKLKSTYSQRGAMYMQVGVEYARHVSSLIKSGITTIKHTPFSLKCEETMSCLFHLRSSSEDAETESSSNITLRPGTGDYYDFFPANQGDALLVEVQNEKKAFQGRAIIPISSLTDNPNDKIKWWPIYHEDQECVGKVQLSISSAVICDDAANIKSVPIVETLAYDLLLEASMRAQNFCARKLWLEGPWKWLLTEFADYYGVSDSYTKLRYLSHIMNVATPTKDCLDLVHELLVPVIKARSEKTLTRQEKTILLDCETQVESLLENAFENYKSLNENSPTGLVDVLGLVPDAAAPALAPAVLLYTLLHDILAQDAQTVLRNYLRTAARKRCRAHMTETDEFVSGNNSDGFIDPVGISTAYLKMKNLCINICNEIQADIKIHNQHVLPSSIDLTSITSTVYSTELCKRLRAFLAAWPPSRPQPHVNELLIATADFERNLESWSISAVQGGVDSRNLYHDYIMVWVQDMQLNLLEFCKAEKVPWSGVITNYSTSPFAEEMYEKIKEMLSEYEVVINRWPQYMLILEHAVANVERAIIKAMEKQYNDILTPLKDSVPKRLGMQVQKLTGRQSTTIYTIPNQLGTFLNTIKRILDILHCRVEDKLKSWASYLPVNNRDKKANFGEQMNGITVLLRTKYKTYMQATIAKLINNMQASRSTRLQRILEETEEADGEAEVRERMQMLTSQLVDSISNLHEVFTSRIFVAVSRGFWDKMGEIVLKFLEGRKENRVWYNGSYHALGILDDTFASQMQRLEGNALQEKDIEAPRSIMEARSILSRDASNAGDTSTYMYF